MESNPPSPFALEADWLDHSWKEPLEVVDRVPGEAIAEAQSALRAVFPPALTASLRATCHPAVYEPTGYAPRLRLLEVGLAIACAGVDEDDLGRLRNANEYESVSSELRADLMLLRAGGAPERPPAVLGKPRCEREVTFPSGQRFAVEVKLPETGDRELGAQRVQLALYTALTQRLSGLVANFSGVRATFRFAPAIMHLSDPGAINTGRLATAVDEASERVAAVLGDGSMGQTIDLGPIGSLVIQPERGSLGVSLEAFGPRIEPKKAMRRLTRNLLKRGAQQVSATPLPGIIILDAKRDYTAVAAIDALRGWALQRPSLAAILIVDATVDGVDKRMYGNVSLVAGPRFGEASEVIASLLDCCEDNHAHYNPLCTPSHPCPMTHLPKQWG